MRTYTSLEKVLVKYGFKEMFGTGLWGVSDSSVFVDTCSGQAVVRRNVDSSFDDFIGIFDEEEVDALTKILEELKVNSFHKSG